MASKKPNQAPDWNVDGFITKLNQIAAKVGISPFNTTAQPAWKRWVEASGDQDVAGLRDVVNTNAIYLDDVKGDLDTYKGLSSSEIADLDKRVAALEAAPALPFPASG
jgi:hypothetical protein